MSWRDTLFISGGKFGPQSKKNKSHTEVVWQGGRTDVLELPDARHCALPTFMLMAFAGLSTSLK